MLKLERSHKLIKQNSPERLLFRIGVGPFLKGKVLAVDPILDTKTVTLQ